jgi:hypothetical protein
VTIFEAKQSYTDDILTRLRAELGTELGEQEAAVIGEHTCVYATGSCGRGEMGSFSDLDAYVLRIGEANAEHDGIVRAAIEAANERMGLPPLDGDGRYVRTVAAGELKNRLGAPEDDAQGDGVFTKRMLLLLESRVVLGESAYRSIIEDVTDAYWQNAEIHHQDYQPFVLVNDIVRWWRILLLNHESDLRKVDAKLRAKQLSEQDHKSTLLAVRRYRSYKMRLARCLTCFSALTYLLALTPTDTSPVRKEDVYRMVGLRPLERLSRLPEIAGRSLPALAGLQATYGDYLERMDRGKDALVERLRGDAEFAKALSKDGGRFTELMFELVQDLGGGRRLHRHMLV